MSNRWIHIHGAILALCNDGFDDPDTRAEMDDLVIDLSILHMHYSNIESFIRNALAEGAIAFRPDTPMHLNEERRYPGGKLKERPDYLRPRLFEFGAVGGGMRVVFDNDDEEIYISAHYAFPGRLVATDGSAEEDWLLGTQWRLHSECDMMIDHTSDKASRQRAQIEQLRAFVQRGQAAAHLLRDAERKANSLETSLELGVTRNKAFQAWLRDPKSNLKWTEVEKIYYA
jgi:hypothetical protein